jgi:glucose-6-phosphate isomerase
MLHLDITAALAKTLTPSLGIPDQDLLAMKTSMKRMVSDIQSERKNGQHAWMQDPYNEDMVKRVRAIAKRAESEKIQTVLWIGIGGSGLGPKVLQEMFEGPETMEFILVDTIDPTLIELYLKIMDWKRTLVVVVSKSGETLESMSAFFLFYEELKKALGKKAASHTIAITDPANGSLHRFAIKEGIEMLPIPPDVGGRYCIFTPVGLLPLALLNADIDKFLQGATDMDTACQNENVDENPAALLAAVQFLLESKKGYLIRVIMPYAQRMQSIARWNQQLIAESLGKNEVHNPFPVAAIGTQDQHSLLQQWIQGPHKCWHLFIAETEKPRITVPTTIPAEWKYIAGKSFGQLLDACLAGTSQGLTAARRAHVTVSLTRLDEYHLGQLFFFFLAEVIFLGKLYRIDPYGQPGVELSKRIAKDLLGHSREN